MMKEYDYQHSKPQSERPKKGTKLKRNPIAQHSRQTKNRPQSQRNINIPGIDSQSEIVFSKSPEEKVMDQSCTKNRQTERNERPRPTQQPLTQWKHLPIVPSEGVLFYLQFNSKKTLIMSKTTQSDVELGFYFNNLDACCYALSDD